MRTFFYVLTALGCLVGGFFLFLALTSAESAPQEASLAAIAVAFAVLPYCFARAIERVDDAGMADDLRVVANYYRRLEQQATQQRVEATRRAANPTSAQSYPSPQSSATHPAQSPRS